MKWKYDSRCQQWWCPDNHYWLIEKSNGRYTLSFNYFKHMGSFKKLKNAKLVAELIENG